MNFRKVTAATGSNPETILVNFDNVCAVYPSAQGSTLYFNTPDEAGCQVFVTVTESVDFIFERLCGRPTTKLGD